MGSRCGNGTHKHKKKEDKKAIRLPAIPHGPTSLCQAASDTQTVSQRLHQFFSSNCLADFGPLDKTIRTANKWTKRGTGVHKLSKETERFIEDRLRRRLGHNNPLSSYTDAAVLEMLGTAPAPFYKTPIAIRSLTEPQDQRGSPEVLVQSMAPLGHEEEEEEEEAGPGGGAGTTTSCESGARPSGGSDASPEGDAAEGCLLLPRRPRQAGRDPSAGGQRRSRRKGPPPPPFRGEERRFMVYICGGYEDTVAERNALMEDVYPALYRHCKGRGYDFRMVDLRQGVGSPAANRHDTAQLHVETIRRCQETPGPNFVLFLGQKHEVRSAPATVSCRDFRALVEVMERDLQRASLRRLSTRHGSKAPGGGPAGESALLSFGEQTASSCVLLSAEASQSSIGGPEEDPAASGAGALERSWGDLDKDLGLIRAWYRLDENSVPAVYHLLPISTHHPDILSQDGERRRLAMKDWGATCQRLCWVLQRSGTEALGEEGVAPLLKTVLDWETEEGLRSLGDLCPPEDHCHCYKRVIPDLCYNLKSEHAARYVDTLKGRPQVNTALAEAHQKFMGRVYDKLRHTNIYERDVGWGRRGLDPQQNRSHRFYTERICSHFKRTALSSLDKVMVVSKDQESLDILRKKEQKSRLWEEVQYHRDHREALARKCLLRVDFLSEVQRAAEAPGCGPLLLLGAPGWGKSSLLARASQQLSACLPGAREATCFIGLTEESRNVRLVLQSLCVQMAQACAPHRPRLSTGLPQLSNEFRSLLGRAGAAGSAAGPWVVLLDGLDELSGEGSADLSWLEGPLPPHVHLLLSAGPDSAGAAALQKSPHTTTLSIPPLGPPDIEAGLERGLRACGRRLRGDQRKLLLEACAGCPCPLYLEAALWESRLWTSGCGVPQGGLAGPLEGLYAGLLGRLEREHGQHLVRRAATLLTVSRGGCTEEELLDLLAKDGKVVQETAWCRSSAWSSSGVPYVLWARLRRDLGPHLREARTDGTWVYRWSHTALGAACARRYLKTENSRKAAHADYAEYFAETSARAATFQPLAWRRGAGSGEGADAGGGEGGAGGGAESCVFNLRKLHGLPYHLVHSGQILPFMRECVFRYEFLLHKAQGLSVLDVEDDLRNAVLPDKEIVDVEVLAGALALSRAVLEDDPRQLASQIMGRLGQILAEDRPVAPGDPLKFSYLHTLLGQCAQSALPVLVPANTCLLPPGGLAHHLLAGHSSPITALGGGLRGPAAVSSEADGSIHLWDLEKRGVVRTLGAEGGVAADHLTLGMDDSMLVVCMGQSLQVREIATGRLVYSEDDSVDVPMVTTTCDGQLLVAFYDGSRLIKVFDLAASCSLLRCVHMELEARAIHKDRSVVLSSNSFRDYVLFAYRSGSEAALLSAREGTVAGVLSAQHAAASIQAVDMTSQYLLLFCRYPYKADGEIVHIELFSATTFLFLRSIMGCGQDRVARVTVTRTGSHAVAFCPSDRAGLTDVVTWNLETEDHKHVVRAVGLLAAGLCGDLRHCVGFCAGERHLRLWDVSSRINDQSLTYNVHRPPSDGTRAVAPASPRYAVCHSTRAGGVSVWNLARRRHAGRPVRVERGLCGPADVALSHGLRLYILTDRGAARSADTPTPVFQTLLVYDLVKRSYLRRKTGLYVVPCLQQEYSLLEEGRLLLGLSETRDHLILWDLESGYIQERIKPSRKESLLAGGVPGEQQPPTAAAPREKTMMPWDLRTESRSSRGRRLQREAQREKEEQRRVDREKYNAIEQYLLSGDTQVVVCSYFAHHLNVFAVGSQEHVHTLEDRTSQLSLRTAALTHAGGFLVLSNYSQTQRTPYVTLWDLRRGTVRKRLRNEPGVCCVAITDNASRVAFGVAETNKLKVWDPFGRKHKSISGYLELKFSASSRLFMTEGGAKAFLLSDKISLWDLDSGSVLSVFSPDARVLCATPSGGGLLLGLSHSPALIHLRLTSPAVAAATREAPEGDLFGESSSSEDEAP